MSVGGYSLPMACDDVYCVLTMSAAFVVFLISKKQLLSRVMLDEICEYVL